MNQVTLADYIFIEKFFVHFVKDWIFHLSSKYMCILRIS